MGSAQGEARLSMHSVVKHIPFPAGRREGKGSTSFDSHRTALQFYQCPERAGKLSILLKHVAPLPLLAKSSTNTAGCWQSPSSRAAASPVPELGDVWGTPFAGWLAMQLPHRQRGCEEQPALLPRATTASSRGATTPQNCAGRQAATQLLNCLLRETAWRLLN